MGTRLISNSRTSDECPGWLDSSVGQSVTSKLQGDLGYHFESRSNLELLMIVKSLLGSFLLYFFQYFLIASLYNIITGESAPKKQKTENFRQKEKRKRDQGQSSRGKSYVEEEKRILRQDFSAE